MRARHSYCGYFSWLVLICRTLIYKHVWCDFSLRTCLTSKSSGNFLFIFTLADLLNLTLCFCYSSALFFSERFLSWSLFDPAMVLSLSFPYHLIFSRYCLLHNFLLFHLKDAFVPDFSISNMIANIAEQDKEVEGIYHKHFYKSPCDEWPVFVHA